MKARHLMAIIVYLAAMLGFVVTPLYRMIEKENKILDWTDAATTIRKDISSLWAKTPQGVDPRVWRCAVDQLHAASSEICVSTGPNSQNELDRLRNDLALITNNPLSLQSLESIWTRLAQTTPSGPVVTQKYKHSFTACCE